MRLAVAAGSAALLLAACTGSSDEATPVSVVSGENSCDVSPTTASAGTVVFSIQNSDQQPTEFYVYGDGDTVVAELEDIGPGAARDLVAQLQPGTYTTACKPGMTGDGIRGSFTVS